MKRVVILGGSGSGKSTLMKHMIGLYEPMAGAVYIDGDDIVTAEGDACRAILKKIGVMYQSGALFGSMTVGENVALPLRRTIPGRRTHSASHLEADERAHAVSEEHVWRSQAGCDETDHVCD